MCSRPYTRINIFEILLNQTEIRLYLQFSDWFETKRTTVWLKINRKMVNTIWFLFDLIRFRKDLSVCNIVLLSASFVSVLSSAQKNCSKQKKIPRLDLSNIFWLRFILIAWLSILLEICKIWDQLLLSAVAQWLWSKMHKGYKEYVSIISKISM